MDTGQRIESVDLARGIASLIMIQGHAYEGWVAAEHTASEGYLFTRLLGTLPLPSFLVLAGAAVALRLRAASGRGESILQVRRNLVARGLSVILWGYILSLACALLDGGLTPGLVLRADVLHAIGLSIALVALWCLFPSPSPRNTPLGGNPAPRALLLALALTALCPLAAGLTRDAAGPSAYFIALFSQVDGITRMPVIPLAAWTASGIVALQLVYPRSGREAPTGRLLALGIFGLAAAFAGSAGTGALLAALGGELDRAHIAVIPNVLDGAGRGLFVLGFGAWLAGKLPYGVRTHLIRIGQASLVTYIFHIPFCYGTLASPLANRLDMPTATLFVLLLMLASYGAVIVLGPKRRLLYDLVPPSLLDARALGGAVRALPVAIASRVRGRAP